VDFLEPYSGAAQSNHVLAIYLTRLVSRNFIPSTQKKGSLKKKIISPDIGGPTPGDWPNCQDPNA
jgi:hypothetical protein